MKFKIIAAAALAALSGCAKAPEAIMAAYTPDFAYQALSCDQLAQESIRVNSALNAAYAQQRQARNNDVMGVILIGLPVSSLSGDNIAEQVASLKGQSEAIHRTGLLKNCPPPFAAPPPPIETH